MKRLAIITTHPIQYNAPLFRLLAERGQIEVKVFYTWSQSKTAVFDARFGIERSWDIPLLDGYESVFIDNTAKHPDSNRFWGIINPGLLQAIKAYQPAAVLVYRWSVYSHLKLMQLIGQSTLLFFRGDSHLQNKATGFKDAIKTIFLKWVYRKVDKAFYVGTYNKAYYQKYGLTDHQLIAAPHAVDNHRFSQDAEQIEKAANAEREKLGIPAAAIVYLYAGKFYALKQLHLLIQAFKSLINDDIRLLLYGNGEQEEQLKALASGDHRIIFEPFKNQSEMPMVYRVGDVFMLTSQSETWGLAVNEAMACGRPAIVSDHCGCAPELIVEGVTGYVFQSNQEQDLIRCMEQFKSRQQAKEKGEQAFQHINRFTLDIVASAIEKAVNE